MRKMAFFSYDARARVLRRAKTHNINFSEKAIFTMSVLFKINRKGYEKSAVYHRRADRAHRL